MLFGSMIIFLCRVSWSGICQSIVIFIRRNPSAGGCRCCQAEESRQAFIQLDLSIARLGCKTAEQKSRSFERPLFVVDGRVKPSHHIMTSFDISCTQSCCRTYRTSYRSHSA